MNRLFVVLFFALAACGGGGTTVPVMSPTSTTPVAAPVVSPILSATNGTVTISADPTFGDAVTSVIDAHGNQYVNNSDHGRQFQTAYTLDALGEGENPTEAGSATDGSGATSTSIISGSATGNTLSTCVNPAYWRPYNGATVSPDTLCKTVTVGYGALANVLQWAVSVTLVSDHTGDTFEGLTGYGPPLPNLFVLQSDGSFSAVTQTANNPIQYNSPIIEASADLSQAIGIYTPNSSANNSYMNSYNTEFVGVNKWDGCWWNGSTLAGGPYVYAITAGTYKWNCFVAVGTLAEVEAAISALTAP